MKNFHRVVAVLSFRITYVLVRTITATASHNEDDVESPYLDTHRHADAKAEEFQRHKQQQCFTMRLMLNLS